MGFQVFRILDDELRRDDGDKGFGGQVAGLFTSQGLEGCFEVVVLVVFGANIVVIGACFLGTRVSWGSVERAGLW